MEDLEKTELEIQPKKKFDYNVIIIILCFMSILFGLGMWGARSYFTVPVTEALGFTRAEFAIVDTMRYVSGAITSLIFGLLIGKFPTKVLLLIGFAFMAIAAFLFSFTTNLYVFYLGGILYGIGIGLSGTTMMGYIISLVCTKNRGTITGIVLAANGIGGAIAIQIVTPLIKESTFGYQSAYQALAGIFIAMFVILLILYREPHKPEGATVKKKKARGAGWVGISFNEATKKTYFYGACVCIFLTGLCLQGVGGCKAPHMQDVGLDLTFIASVGTVSSLLLTTSKFLNGFLYDRIGLRWTITIDCASSVIFMAMLYFINNSLLGMVLCVLITIFYAIALPLETVMIPIYANDLFGDKSYAKILGIFSAINQAGYALGGIIINSIFDAFGSYKIAIVLCGIIMIAVVVFLQFIISSANKVKNQVMLELEQQN